MEVKARRAPIAKIPAQTDVRVGKILVFITVGLLIDNNVLQIRELFQHRQFGIQRLVDHLFGKLVLRIALQFIH